MLDFLFTFFYTLFILLSFGLMLSIDWTPRPPKRDNFQDR